MAIIINAFVWGIGGGALFAAAKREAKRLIAKRRSE